jgi:putative ABC transport system permease protein
MVKLFPLVWFYLVFHKGKTLILLFCLTVAIFLPLTVHLIVDLLQKEMVERAEATPLVIGPQGSRFDLVLHALYFHSQAQGTLPQGERFAVEETGHAAAIPLFIRYRARGFPVVGTTLDYLSFRNLRVAEGRPLTILGDCLVGWEVSRRLGLGPGDRLLTDPENVFDLGGSYPLDMRVTGVLERSHSPDDRAVFVDLQTAWVIEGLGHGHQELGEAADPEDVLERTARSVRASPALPMYTRITPENIDSFHFHGDPAAYPLTALLALPHDPRSRSLLLGRYVADNAPYQALRPSLVVAELLGMVIQLKRFFDLHHLFMLVVTGVFIVLVMMLSLRLRRQEANTMFQIGCSRGTLWFLQAGELIILLVLSLGLAFAGSRVAVHFARGWIQALTG